MTPSAHVLDMFVVPDLVERLPGSRSVVAGDLVLSPGRDAGVAAWLSPALAQLAVGMDERPMRRPRDLRVAVPVPARDGSWVVDGWAATRYEPDARQCSDLDVLVAVGRSLHAELAVATPARPPGLSQRADRWAQAERLAFDTPRGMTIGAAEGAPIIRVAAGLEAVDLGRDQLVHADLAGNVLLDVAGAPVVIDFSPAWRPPLWAEAVCVVDAVTGRIADIECLEEWQDRRRRQALLRAVAFRLLSDPSEAQSTYADVLDRLGL